MRAFLSIALLLALLVCASVFAQRTPVPVAVCGDGISQGVEECDDGNVVAGDGCGPTCQLELARTTQTPGPIGTPLPTRAAEPTPFSAFTDEIGGRYSLRKGRMRAEIATGKLAIRRDDDGRGIEFDFGVAVPTLRGERAAFVVDGLEWDTAITTTGTKAAATVVALRGPQTYRFPFRLLNLSGNASIAANGDADFGPFKVLRLWATDAAGARRDASPWRVVGGVLEADLDDAGLTEPYVIDPTTVFSFTGTWWNAGWLYRQKVTCGGQNAPASNLGGGTITSGFPCRVTLTGGTVANDAIGVNFSSFNSTQSATAQGDLCFIADDQTTVLNHEVEVWNTTSTDQVCTGANCATIWVGVPTVTASTGTAIWMYYGNSSATSCGGTVPSKTGVWNFWTVWHIKESSGSIADSTTSNYPGTVAGNPTYAVSAQHDGGMDFDGTTDRISNTLISATTVNYASGWLMPDVTVNASSTCKGLFGFRNVSGTELKFIEVGGNCTGSCTSEYITLADSTGSSTRTCVVDGGSIASGGWHHIAMSWNSSVSRYDIIIDGATKAVTYGTASGHVAQITNPNRLDFPDDTLSTCIAGLGDEFRVSATALGAAWAKAEYDVGRGAFNIGAGASNAYVEETRRRQRPQMTY